ncbi:MAG TPA: hypothetical protein VIN58_13185 [Roseateles sp.]
MTRIAQAHVAEAMRAAERMDTQQQVRLSDEILAHQPHLLGSIVVLRRLGASDPQIGIALHVLFVAWLAMKASGHRWPVISEDDQDLCLQRLTARVRCVEGLAPELLQQAVAQHISEHAEPQLLAFAYGHLRQSDLLGARSEAEKYVLLAALNLVECIAFSALPAAH